MVTFEETAVGALFLCVGLQATQCIIVFRWLPSQKMNSRSLLSTCLAAVRGLLAYAHGRCTGGSYSSGYILARCHSF